MVVVTAAGAAGAMKVANLAAQALAAARREAKQVERTAAVARKAEAQLLAAAQREERDEHAVATLAAQGGKQKQ